jgi:hypothetical protein
VEAAFARGLFAPWFAGLPGTIAVDGAAPQPGAATVDVGEVNDGGGDRREKCALTEDRHEALDGALLAGSKGTSGAEQQKREGLDQEHGEGDKAILFKGRDDKRTTGDKAKMDEHKLRGVLLYSNLGGDVQKVG